MLPSHGDSQVTSAAGGWRGNDLLPGQVQFCVTLVWLLFKSSVGGDLVREATFCRGARGQDDSRSEVHSHGLALQKVGCTSWMTRELASVDELVTDEGRKPFCGQGIKTVCSLLSKSSLEWRSLHGEQSALGTSTAHCFLRKPTVLPRVKIYENLPQRSLSEFPNSRVSLVLWLTGVKIRWDLEGSDYKCDDFFADEVSSANEQLTRQGTWCLP